MTQKDSAHSVSGQGGVIAAHVLKEHGVDALFTLSGGHLFPLYDGCVKNDIRLIDVRHEQSAVFAAEGYAKVTRRLGVAALTAGPGVTNGVSAITTAHFTGSPIAVLGGRAPAVRWGQGSLQELDHVPLVDPVTKLALTSTSTEAIATDLDLALFTAQTARRGPTFIDFPLDVFFNAATSQVSLGPSEAALETPPADPDDLQAIGKLLAAAKRPVLMAGADAYWEHAEHALRQLAEEARVPVFMNGLGRGLLPADHELAFSRARKKAFTESDLVIVVGTPLDFRLGFGRFGEAQVVHIMDCEGVLVDPCLTCSPGGGQSPRSACGRKGARHQSGSARS